MMVSDGQNRFMMRGLNSDIVTCWKQCYDMFKEQPRRLVAQLRGESVDKMCESIFSYMVNHTYYRLDDDGVQMIKSPARLIDDGCGDCKSYTMFIASCLHCLGIPCIVRFVNFDGGKQYTHVYPVAIDEQGRQIPMDACELAEDNRTCIYGYARPYSKKYDIVYGR